MKKWWLVLNTDISTWWRELGLRFNWLGWWVTAYEVTREWGGPEEGGWWWNYYAPIQTLPLIIPSFTYGRWASRVRDYLYRRHADRKWGDIYSMAGGVDVIVMTEWCRREYATTERPHYE